MTLSTAEARGIYPPYDRFEIRQQLNPGETFANQFIQELFELAWRRWGTCTFFIDHSSTWREV